MDQHISMKCKNKHLKDSSKEFHAIGFFREYEENVVTSFKSNLLLMIFWLHIINYNS